MKKDSGILKNIQQKILLNPYRLLGVTCNASVRDITRQSSRLKKYLLAGESPTDSSFSKLDTLQRTPEDIEQAVHAISTDESRLFHALFWFWNHNAITDEAALELLGDNKPKEALAVWNKLVINPADGEFKEVTAKNVSAFHNWSLIKLILAFISDEDGSDCLQEAIRARLIMLDSPFWEMFKAGVTDKTYQSGQEQVELTFLNAVLDFDEISVVVDVFKQQFVARISFLDKYFYFVQDRIQSIIRELAEIRSEQIAAVPQYAKKIGVSAKQELKQAAEILPADEYNQLAEQVAQELFQAAISYFNYYSKEENDKSAPKDFGGVSLAILDLAQDFCCSNSLNQRIQQNYQTIRNYEYMEGRIALEAVKHAWQICKDIDGQNNVFSGILPGVPRYEVNAWKLTQMISKFVTPRAIEQLVTKASAAEIAEFERLLQRLNSYIPTYTWRHTLEKVRWKHKCNQAYESFPPYSLKRLFALLAFMNANKGEQTPFFVGHLKRELSSKMMQNIANATNQQQLEVWNALVSALEEFASDYLKQVEQQLLNILQEGSPLKILLQKRNRNRFLGKIFLVLAITFCVGLIVWIVYQMTNRMQMDAVAFEKAKQEDTIEAYDAFIRNSLTQKYVPLAREKQQAIYQKEEEARKLAEEQKIWQQLAKEERYADYLDKYPSGTFAQEAEQAIEKQNWGTEKAAWETAQQTGAWEKYIKLFPNGGHIKQAKEKELGNKIYRYFSRSQGDLPSPTYTGYKAGNALFKISNHTSGTLTMYFRGKVVKEVSIKKDGSRSVSLPPGSYQVVAVTSQDEPFAKVIAFDSGYYEAAYSIHSYYVPRSQYRYRRRH